jgi:hypothetical protein
MLNYESRWLGAAIRALCDAWCASMQIISVKRTITLPEPVKEIVLDFNPRTNNGSLTPIFR